MGKDMGFMRFLQKDTVRGARQKSNKKQKIRKTNIVKPRHLNQSRTSN